MAHGFSGGPARRLTGHYVSALGRAHDVAASVVVGGLGPVGLVSLPLRLADVAFSGPGGSMAKSASFVAWGRGVVERNHGEHLRFGSDIGRYLEKMLTDCESVTRVELRLPLLGAQVRLVVELLRSVFREFAVTLDESERLHVRWANMVTEVGSPDAGFEFDHAGAFDLCGRCRLVWIQHDCETRRMAWERMGWRRRP